MFGSNSVNHKINFTHLQQSWLLALLVASLLTIVIPSIAFAGTITVTGTENISNDPPVADDQDVSTDEETALAVTLTSSDIDLDSLSYSVVATPTHGTLSDSGTSLTYTPDANYHGTDSFTFQSTDGSLDSNLATISITVNPANDTPTADDQTATTEEDTLRTIILTGSDLDGDSITYNVTLSPSHGSLSGSAPNLTYTPDTNYTGPDSISFEVCDPSSACATGMIDLTVGVVNDPPIAQDGAATSNEDVAVAIPLQASDVENNSLSYSVIVSPSQGTLSGTAPDLIYTPDSNFNGNDSFSFRANDGLDDSNLATVAITVTAVNDVPIANEQNVSTAEDADVAITLTGSDVEGDALTYSIVTPPTHGTLSGTAADIIYTPAANYQGSDSFSFQNNDGQVDSNPANVTVTISAINDAPVANNQNLSLSEDQTLDITLSASDVDGDALTYSVILSPTHGTLSGSLPNLTYTPDANYQGSDSFAFRANDGSADSNKATIELTIHAINDFPVLNDQSLAINEDEVLQIMLNASDIDGDLLSYSISWLPEHGVVSGAGDTQTYTPTANYHGSDSYMAQVCDNAPTPHCVIATIEITISPINDAPVANDQSVTTNEDSALAITIGASDVDGDALRYTVSSKPQHGTIGGIGVTKTYTPNANYHGNDSFVVKVCENAPTALCTSATVDLTITPINDAPTAANQTVSSNEDTDANITLAGDDLDGDALSFAVETDPIHGTLSGSAPNLTYTPDADYHGTDSFSFRSNDGQADSNLATVVITIHPVNDIPVADNQTLTTAEDAARSFILTGSDVDGDLLTFSVVNPPSHGSLSGAAPNLTYTPDANYTGLDSITFGVCDSEPTCDQGVIVLTVGVVNDAPLAQGASFTTTEDVAVNIVLQASDTDGDSLTYEMIADPRHGRLTGIAPNLIYTPEVNFNGTDNFTFRVNDGLDNSNLAKVVITVQLGNDAPMSADQNKNTNEDTSVSIVLTADDVDGDTLTFALVAPPSHGTLTGSAPNLTYTPASNYHGSDSFIFRTNDGKLNSAPATVTISVNPSNDAPLALAQNLTINEDGSRNITLTGNDVDGDSLTFMMVESVRHGTLSGSGTNFIYTPEPNYNGADSFTFQVDDGSIGSALATIQINVTPVNDPPTANPQSLATDKDKPLAILLTSNDVDGATLSYSIVTAPQHGTLSGSAPNLTYTPDSGFKGSDSFTFRASNGTTASAPATISITINPEPGSSGNRLYLPIVARQ